MRMGCSKLNNDLCYNLHVINDPNCICCGQIEDAFHFFFVCLKYERIRLILVNTISKYCYINLQIVLYGNPDLSVTINRQIIDAVHTYIVESKRFC